MQNVACAITIVQMLSWMPRIVRKPFWNARPVTMPGSAIGRMISSETTLRPKKRVRRNPIAASVPSTSAIAVAQSATWMLVNRASLAPALSTATFHQCRVNPGGGQPKVLSVLKELTSTSSSGT